MTSENEIFDVIIIGCGPAGIAAAIDFQKIPNLKCRVLEARNRVGGRVITDTITFGDDTPIDLGAQWLHHYRPENPLREHQHLTKDTYLNYHFVIRSSTTPFFDIDGTKISAKKVAEAEEIFNRLCKTIEETILPIDKSILDVLKDDFHEYEQITDKQIKRLIDLFFGIIEQYEASNLDQLSTKSYIAGDKGLEGCNLAIPNGFGLFIQDIVRKHDLSVELNTIVTRIDVLSNEELVRISTANERTYLCRYVLVTIPLGCLKKQSIEFHPALPDWKQNAIDRMGVGISDKIFLQFSRIFWDSTWTSIFCTSARFRFILCRPENRMLIVKLTARVALEIEEKNEQETIDEIMNLLRSFFVDREVPEPTRYLFTKWGQDKFSQGSYSNFAVGTDNQTLIDLARECHERIYWAGEHANYDGTIGCVDSAFESGKHQAQRIAERFNK